MKDVMLTILQVVLIAVIPVIAAYVCRFLKAKRDFEENSARIIQAQTDVSLDFDASSKTIHRDYLETDYK